MICWNLTKNNRAAPVWSLSSQQSQLWKFFEGLKAKSPKITANRFSPRKVKNNINMCSTFFCYCLIDIETDSFKIYCNKKI